ncbi:uncharacterized protein [Anas platyrhynchos]|uniref:uncharacterized protein isoform X3 n=1 Tax=Anas platyrhynchos TaxID=8839 RepID=UPI003AF28796
MGSAGISWGIWRDPVGSGGPHAPPGDPVPLSPSQWRCVRLFVSSTFLDLGAERDALVRAALPRLRALAAPRGLGVQEVDLRWGVAAPDPQRRQELCLEEVARSDVLLGVLGERYGQRGAGAPPAGLPPGRSVTELELRTFLQRWSPAHGPAPALIYMRDPAFLREVPEERRGDFGAESAEAAAMMAALKAELKEHPGVAAVRSYGCRWEAGEVTGLEAFVDQVVADVWALLQRHFLRGPPPSLQEAFLAAKMAAASARQRLVAARAAAIQDGRHSRLLVTGEPGDGRTVFLASLVGALRQAPPPSPRRPRPRCVPAYHFAGARPDQSDARVALAHLCAQLAALRGHAPPGDHAHPGGHAPLEGATYGSLRLRLLSLLATPPPRGLRLVLVVDDAGALHEGGAPRRDWLPEKLPPRVTLVLSGPAPRPGPAQFLEVGGAWDHLPLGPLPPGDRARLLEAELRKSGRSLDPDQVRRVLAKGGARQPLYLQLLLAELGAFARHEDAPPGLRLPIGRPRVPPPPGQLPIGRGRPRLPGGGASTSLPGPRPRHAPHRPHPIGRGGASRRRPPIGRELRGRGQREPGAAATPPGGGGALGPTLGSPPWGRLRPRPVGGRGPRGAAPRRQGAQLWGAQAHRGPVTALSPRPGGGLLSTGLDGTLQELGPRRGAPFSALCWSADGSRLAAAQVGGALSLWAWPDEAPPPAPPRPLRLADAAGHVTAIAFAPPPAPPTRILTAGAGGEVLVWEAGPGRLRAELPPLDDVITSRDDVIDRDDVINHPDDVINHPDDVINHDDIIREPDDVIEDLDDVIEDPDDVTEDPDDIIEGFDDVIDDVTAPLDDVTTALGVAFDPWGGAVAVGQPRGGLALYRAPWGPSPCWRGGRGLVTHVTWVGGAKLVGAGPGGALWGWEVPAPPARPRPLFKPRPLRRGPITALAGAGAGLAVGTEDGTLWLCPADAVGLPPKSCPAVGRLLHPHQGHPTAAAFSPTGTLLGTAGTDRALAVWDFAVGRELRRWPQAHGDQITALGWARELLVSGAADCSVGLWDVAGGQRLRQLGGLPGPPCALGGHGRAVLAVSRCGAATSWDGAGRPRGHLRGHLRAPASGDVAPPGAPRALVAVTGSDGRTRLWHPLEPAPPRPLGALPGGAVGLGVVPGGKVLTASDCGVVALWDLEREDDDPNPPLPVGPVAALDWDPRGARVASGGPGGHLALWEDGRVVARGTVAPPPVSAVAFGAERRLLVAAGRRLEFWGLRGRKGRLRLRLLPDPVSLPCPIIRLCRARPQNPDPKIPVLIALADGALWGWGKFGKFGKFGVRPLRVDLAPEPSLGPLLELLRGDGAGTPPGDDVIDDIIDEVNDEVIDDVTDDVIDDVTPFALHGTPFGVEALPGGGWLLLGGLADPYLCHLAPRGSGFEAVVFPVWGAPIPAHGPTRWFTGGCLLPDMGLYLSRSDGTLWVCPGWGQRNRHLKWHQRRVSRWAVTALGTTGGALVTTARDGLARIWDPRGGAPLSYYRCPGPITCLALGPRPPPGSAPRLAVGDQLGGVHCLRWVKPTPRDTPPF